MDHGCNQNSALVVLTTCPDSEVAAAVAETLVNERLAACVNILPGVTSVYRWQGQVEHDSEVLLLIKTTETVYSVLERRVIEVHPYEVPEVIAVSVEDGLARYLRWLEEQVSV